MTDTPASWIIVDVQTGRAVRETFSWLVAATAIETGKFRAIPAAEYLASLNKESKE